MLIRLLNRAYPIVDPHPVRGGMILVARAFQLQDDKERWSTS